MSNFDITLINTTPKNMKFMVMVKPLDENGRLINDERVKSLAWKIFDVPAGSVDTPKSATRSYKRGKYYAFIGETVSGNVVSALNYTAIAPGQETTASVQDTTNIITDAVQGTPGKLIIHSEVGAGADLGIMD